MSDLFHENLARHDIAAIFGVMAYSQRHTFQVLTKRPEQMWKFMVTASIQECTVAAVDRLKAMNAEDSTTQWPLPNIWLGVSVEDQKSATYRIPLLLDTPAAIRWLSYEPALGSLDLSKIPSTESLDWIVCGGESGPHARPMHIQWARSIRDQCIELGIPFFFKQWGEWAPGLGEKERFVHSIAGCSDFPSRAFGHDCSDFGDGYCAVRLGKKRAGNLLDDHLWLQYFKEKTNG